MRPEKVNRIPSLKVHETAESLLTTAVPFVDELATIKEVEKLLVDKNQVFETVNYIYVLNQKRKLKGIFSIKEIFHFPKNTPVKNLMIKKILTVPQHTHQEKIAFLALKYNLSAIPILDKDKNFIGVVTSDTILRILDSEAVENLFRLSGVMHNTRYDDVSHLSLFKSLKHRLPWLIVGLLGGLFASGIVNSFEKVLSRNLILASFVPLIVYMSDAVGTQMEAFIIRDLAVDENLKFLKYFFRQFLVVLLMGALLSLLFYGIGILFYNNPEISLVVAFSLFFAIMSSLISGLVIPFLFSKLKLDPANASGPVATVIQDLTSIFIYFTVATLFL